MNYLVLVIVFVLSGCTHTHRFDTYECYEHELDTLATTLETTEEYDITQDLIGLK